MKLLELTAVAAIVGILGAIATPSLMGQVEKSEYAQAYTSIGIGLTLEACPASVNGWIFECLTAKRFFQVSAVKKGRSLKIVGAKHDGQKLFCKDIGDLTADDITSGHCPNLSVLR